MRRISLFLVVMLLGVLANSALAIEFSYAKPTGSISAGVDCERGKVNFTVSSDGKLSYEVYGAGVALGSGYVNATSATFSVSFAELKGKGVPEVFSAELRAEVGFGSTNRPNLRALASRFAPRTLAVVGPVAPADAPSSTSSVTIGSTSVDITCTGFNTRNDRDTRSNYGACDQKIALYFNSATKKVDLYLVNADNSKGGYWTTVGVQTAPTLDDQDTAISTGSSSNATYALYQLSVGFFQVNIAYTEGNATKQCVVIFDAADGRVVATREQF